MGALPLGTQSLSAQENKLVYENNEYKMFLSKYDSTYSIIGIERYHDESHYFGTIRTNGDTIIFFESDTFLLIEPRVYYTFEESIPEDKIELNSRISFFNAPEWKTVEDSIVYVINDSTKHQYDFNFNKDNEYHTLLIDSKLKSFSLRLGTGYMESSEIPINLKIDENFENFHQKDINKPYFNKVVIRMKIVGTMNLPGLFIESFAPKKIIIDRKEYYFKTESEYR